MATEKREKRKRKEEEIIMLRGFVKCVTDKERLEYIMDNRFGNWSASELDSVMDIVGVKGDYSRATQMDKIMAIADTIKAERIIKEAVSA